MLGIIIAVTVSVVVIAIGLTTMLYLKKRAKRNKKLKHQGDVKLTNTKTTQGQAAIVTLTIGD